MGGPRRRWNEVFPRGSVVDHPAVREVVAMGDPGTTPSLTRVQGTAIVAYSATRVFMKRDAWELLAPEGILLQWIRPAGETPWAIALTRSELERVFGEVTVSESWANARCYHFPTVPPAALAFRVLGAPTTSPDPARPDPSPPQPERALTGEAPVSTEVAAERVLRHLRTHASLTEAEVTHIAGGAREYRRLRRHFEGVGSPIAWESTSTGVLWRLAKDSS